MKRQDAALDIARCARAGSAGAEGFFRAGFMAVTSMRLLSPVFWRGLAREYEATRRAGVEALSMNFRFGHKGRALEELLDQAPALAALARDARRSDEAADDLHEALCKIHGLRSIKAGFIVQLTTGRLMCFDSVHCNQYGLDIRSFAARWNRRNGPAQYRDFVRRLDTVGHWAAWCRITSARDYADPRRVSLAHPSFLESGRIAPLSSTPLFDAPVQFSLFP